MHKRETRMKTVHFTRASKKRTLKIYSFGLNELTKNRAHTRCANHNV